MFKIEDYYIKNSKSYKTIMKFKTIHENKNNLEQFYKPSSNPNDVISNLQRYFPFNSSELIEDVDGKYDLLSDVINLSRRKNNKI